jgi:hypothetical protein
MKSAPVLHHSTKLQKKLSKHSVFVLNSVVENLLVSLWFMTLKQTSRNLKYDPQHTFSCFFFHALTFSHTIEKSELVFRRRLRNLLDNNGNRGRIGVRSLGGQTKRRPLILRRRARNRCCIYCCGSHLFMSFYSVVMSIWNNTNSWRTISPVILWTSILSPNSKPAIIRAVRCIPVLDHRPYTSDCFNG